MEVTSDDIRDSIRHNRAMLNTIILALVSFWAPPQTDHVSVVRMLPELNLLEPAWMSPVVHRESSVLLQMNSQGPVSARLGFPAAEILEVATADRKHRFKVGADVTLADDKSTLVFSNPQPLVPIQAGDLFPPRDAPHSYRHRVGNPDQNLLYRPGSWFHEHNIEITYRRADPPAPRQPEPDSFGKLLPKTLARLRAGQPLTLGVSGDSISTGLDASALTQVEPNQPGYPNLVAGQLQSTYRSEITLCNRAVAGWSIVHGVDDLDKLLAEKPQVIVVAYGMNDVGRRDPKWFGEQVRAFVDKVHKSDPEIEVILVATMLGNAEWIHTPREMFSRYRDELRAITGPGVALADLTEVWDLLLKRKHDLDLTGNGLNHPNDFGHRLYAQAILSLLVPKP